MFLDGLVPAPSWLNAGDTGWQLTAATFVGLQSIPGLAILYAGLMKRKWALNSAVMVLYAFAMTLLVWTLWAYNMGFGNPVKIGHRTLHLLRVVLKPRLEELLDGLVPTLAELL